MNDVVPCKQKASQIIISEMKETPRMYRRIHILGYLVFNTPSQHENVNNHFQTNLKKKPF